MANVDIELGYKDAAWFTANATHVLKQGQPVFLQQTGQFKIGDGSTQLQNLSFLGGIVQSYTANNGITKTGNNFQLGGSLTQDTNITGGGTYDLNLGTDVSQLKDFGVYCKSLYLSTDGGNEVTPYLYLDGVNNFWVYGNQDSYLLHSGSSTTLYSTGDLIFNGNNLIFGNGSSVYNFSGANLSPSTVPVLDGSNNFISSSVTTTQLNLLTSFNANVTGSTLTGFIQSAGTVGATDTILSAFQKVTGNIALLTGAVIYQGTWNANTNSPALASGVGTKGYLYKVGTAGTTTIDGISQWNVGDQIVFNGTTWDKIDGIANEVLSVNGLVGAVPLTGSSAINISGTNVFSINNSSITNAMLAGSIDLASKVTGLLSLSNGGTNADLSATGGTSRVLMQTSVGGSISVVQLATSDISDITSWTDYSATSTITGWSSFSIKIIRYRKIGKTLSVYWYLSGTSNSASTNFTFPATSENFATQNNICGFTVDNGTTKTTTTITGVNVNTSIINIFLDGGSNTWTASGTKTTTGNINIAIQ